MQKEIFQTKSRKIKKRNKKKTYIQQFSFFNYFYYHLYMYFLKKNKILLNRKILSYFFVKEIGSIISLQK